MGLPMHTADLRKLFVVTKYGIYVPYYGVHCVLKGCEWNGSYRYRKTALAQGYSHILEHIKSEEE